MDVRSVAERVIEVDKQALPFAMFPAPRDIGIGEAAARAGIVEGLGDNTGARAAAALDCDSRQHAY